MRTVSPRPRYQDSRKPAQRGIVGARSRSRRPRSCTRGDAGADLGASSLPNHRQAGHLRPAPPPLAPNSRAAPPSTGGRARSHEAGPCNQWAARAEWKGLSDPRDVTKLARGAVRFRPRPPLASSPPTRHCAANRKTGSAPARTFGRGRVAARRSRGAEWAGRGRGASLRGVVPACVEGAPGSAAAASSSRRSGFFPGVPGSYSVLLAPSRPVRNPPPASRSCEGAPGARRERRPRACGGRPGRGRNEPRSARCARGVGAAGGCGGSGGSRGLGMGGRARCQCRGRCGDPRKGELRGREAQVARRLCMRDPPYTPQGQG